MNPRSLVKTTLAAFALAGMAGCAYEIGYDPAYAPPATPHALMLQVAVDLRPLLIGECTITDVA